MRSAARENAACALAALAGCAALLWLSVSGFVWNDYEIESRPAFEALLHGHLGEFLRLAPAYGGSLIERAPFVALSKLSAGGALSVYRMSALPCLLAAAALGVWLLARMRREGRPLPARALALAICVVNPITLRALEVGHPEELLGACLCVAAVLLALADRPLWAGLALGLAIANKDWALLAAGPVLLALPSRRRLPCAASAIAIAAAVLAPLLLVHSGGFLTATRASATPTSAIFQPWQVWWFLGQHGAPVHGMFGELKLGYRTGPGWASTIAHPSILAVGLALSTALWLRQRHLRLSRADARSAMLALALLMLLRCLLDTWDTEYYALPFVFALLAWELRGPLRGAPLGGAPLLTLASTALVWLSFQWLPAHASADLQAGFFLLWSLPLALLLGWRLFTAGALAASTSHAARSASADPNAQEITVKALSRPLSAS